MADTENPRKTFDQRAGEILIDGARKAFLEVPELEAVATIMLWRYPDQTGIPEFILTGADGRIVNPETLLRIMQATLRLSSRVNGMAQTSVEVLREAVTAMARDAHEPEASQIRVRGARPEEAAGADSRLQDGTG